MPVKKHSKTESFKVKGEELLREIKRLIREGNIREIKIKNRKGKTIIQIPLTLGVVGVALLPVWAAVGAIAAVVSECTVVVERRK